MKKSFRFYRYLRLGLAAGMVLVLLFLGVCFFSQREITVRNGAVHDKTWRYNSSMAEVDGMFIFSTYDKLRDTTTIRTFSLSDDRLIRMTVVDGVDRISVYENGELIYEKDLDELPEEEKRNLKILDDGFPEKPFC